MSSNIQIVSEQNQPGVYIVQFKTKMLAVFTYYVQSHGECYLIDPTFDYLVYRDFIEKRKTKLKYVVLTHYHADFLSAHTEFKVPVVMGPGSKRQANHFKIVQIDQNGKFKMGHSVTRVISTPGHTMESSCFILSDQNGKQFCVFTGDTVFLKEVGRPDLAVAGKTTIKDLAGMLFDSIQKIKTLDPKLRIYPAHGSGSACGKSIGPGNFCDLQTQIKENYAFLITDRNQFVEKITKDLPAPPKYFFHDATINQQGSSILYEDALNRANKPLTSEQIQTHVELGTLIMDTRHVPINGIIKGSYWVSANAMICQLISHISEPQKQFIVIADEEKRVEVIERFIRVGFLNILGYNGFDMKQWKGQTIKAQIRKIQQLDKKLKQVYIDVRNKPELLETGIFEGALFIPIPQLKGRIKEVEQFVKNNHEKEIVIHCKTGMRARLGASIMMGNSIGPVTVLNQVIDKVHEKGVKLVPYIEK